METEKEMGYSSGKEISLKTLETCSHRKIGKKDDISKYLSRVNNIFLANSMLTRIQFSPFISSHIHSLKNLLHLEIRSAQLCKIENLDCFVRYHFINLQKFLYRIKIDIQNSIYNYISKSVSELEFENYFNFV